ncbi:T9SS type A sorting domain-containing protein [Psychroserpens sp.]|uniref:T9SS type A sorting domain-containing protein n=1 Tax=Psychroserpens sp. TaxID=2020870 RepID=UPI00385CA078
MKQILLLFLLAPFMLQAQWVQVGVDIDGEVVNDTSGFEISLNNEGNIVAIGSYRNDDGGSDAGQVRVYQNNSGSWIQLGNDIEGQSDNDNMGFSVSLNGTGSIVAVSSPGNSDGAPFAGQVKVLQYDGTDWVQLGNNINGSGNVNNFGSSVSLNDDGTILAIGEIGNDTNGNNSGSASIFSFNGTDWIQLGQNIIGEASGDQFGRTTSISSDGSIVAVGAIENDGLISGGGHARVFQNIAGTWTQIGGDIDGDVNNGYLGYSLSLSSNGQTIAVGTINDNDGGSSSGSVTVYEFNGIDWVVKGAKILGDATTIFSGYSTSLNGNGTIVAVGDIGTNGFAGRGRVFQFDGSDWNQIGSDLIGEATNDQSGYSICLNDSGSRVAIGAINNDGNGSNSGHVRVFNEPSLTIKDFIFEDFRLYPNPSSDYVNIEFNELFESISVQVFDVLGKKVIQQEKRGLSTIKLNVSHLKSGIYLVNIDIGLVNKTVKLIIE